MLETRTPRGGKTCTYHLFIHSNANMLHTLDPELCRDSLLRYIPDSEESLKARVNSCYLLTIATLKRAVHSSKFEEPILRIVKNCECIDPCQSDCLIQMCIARGPSTARRCWGILYSKLNSHPTNRNSKLGTPRKALITDSCQPEKYSAQQRRLTL